MEKESKEQKAKNKADKMAKKAEAKKNKAEKKALKNKDKKPNKFIEIIKKKWLINGTKTTILVVALIAIFMALPIFISVFYLLRKNLIILGILCVIIEFYFVCANRYGYLTHWSTLGTYETVK